MPQHFSASNQDRISRRRLLGGVAGAAALALTARVAADELEPGDAAETTPAERKGRIRQSVVRWCFEKHWDLQQTCRTAVELGCESVELVGPEHWPVLKKHGLVCAIAPSHGFVQGMNNPKYQPKCLESIRKAIDDCAAAHFPTVITFTGFAAESDSPPGKEPRVIEPDEGIRNSIAAYKQIVGHAEKKKVNLALEMLNSRVAEEMKGHPGYQGDHVDYCMEIIRGVGSPRLGLLFDIYHVQIMDGDLIQRIRDCREVILHVHTAGNPGRRELDDAQEIQYPPVMRALLEIGYEGYVGQEFIPTGDPKKGLAAAVKLCDV